MKTLVAYASTHGHTSKIAERVGGALREAGLEAVTAKVHGEDDPDPAGCEAVMVGGSLHAGSHQPELVAWVGRHRTLLEEVPSAFFSVSLTAADDTPEARSETQRCIDEFFEATGWVPRRHAAFAGALQWHAYNAFTRVLMRMMLRRGGHPVTEHHEDVEYTDWAAVDAFARELAEAVRAADGR